MPTKTQTQTPPTSIPIPTPTVFNSRLIAPNLLQFKPLTCCKCDYLMLDSEWRCNLCGHDHEYMGDDRREEKYVYIKNTSKPEVKGRRAWRDAIRNVLLSGRGRNMALIQNKDEKEGDVTKAKTKKKKKNQNHQNHTKEGQEGVVGPDTDPLDYDENGNWVLNGELVSFVNGAGQISGTQENGEGNGKKKEKKKKPIRGETDTQLIQRGQRDQQQQQQQDGIHGGFLEKLFFSRKRKESSEGFTRPRDSS